MDPDASCALTSREADSTRTRRPSPISLTFSRRCGPKMVSKSTSPLEEEGTHANDKLHCARSEDFRRLASQPSGHPHDASPSMIPWLGPYTKEAVGINSAPEAYYGFCDIMACQHRRHVISSQISNVTTCGGMGAVKLLHESVVCSDGGMTMTNCGDKGG